jgi:hypothetical protein
MLTDILHPIGNFFAAVGNFIGALWWRIENLLVIQPIELSMRAWYALDPRVYIQSLRVKATIDGNVSRKDDTYFVFVLYAKTSLPDFTQNALNAIARSPHNLIIVSNATLSPLLKAQLQDKCYKLIERKNLGRDFGAYKDGVNYVLEHHPDADRIVLMNDSVFFFQRTIDKLIADLNAPHDFIGVTETHQYHYHVQSFMLSFGREVVRSKAFARFWKRYRPISTRRFTIHRGELRLTRQLTRAGFRPHILYQPAHLLPHLQRKPVRESIELIQLLPIDARTDLYSHFLTVLGEKYSPSSYAALEAVSQGIRRIQAGPPRGADGGQLVRINNQAAGMEQWSFGIFPNLIVSSISRNNQMHHGGLLFIKYLGLPLLKRDIFYRELFTLEETYRFLTDIGEPLRDEVLADLRRSGSGANLKGLFRLMYRHGSL